MAPNAAEDTTVYNKAASGTSKSPATSGTPPRVSIGIIINTCCCRKPGQGDKPVTESGDPGQGDKMGLKAGQHDKPVTESGDPGQGDDFTFRAGDVAIRIEICT